MKNKQLSQGLEASNARIAQVAASEYTRETQWANFLARNKTMAEELKAAKQDLFFAETTKLFSLETTIEEHELKIAKLETECETRRAGAELDK